MSRPSHPNACFSRRAFTLVEILVVIAIIAVLAALLFPVFSSVRRNARLTSCASNLHQVTLALHMYQQDWNKLPSEVRTASNRTISSWSPLISYLGDKSVIKCPYSEMPPSMSYEYGYPTGPNNTVLNPEGSTVVAYCGEHLDYEVSSGTTRMPILEGPNGPYFAGTWIVGRMDGSAERVRGSEAPRWDFYNGHWSVENNSVPKIPEFVAFRFPKEPWPPNFE